MLKSRAVALAVALLVPFTLVPAQHPAVAMPANRLAAANQVAAANPVVAMAATPSGAGYWLVESNGAVAPFGDAVSYGSMAGRSLSAPIRSMSTSPTGRGYWLLGADGGVFNFGDAGFFGSTGDLKLNAPVIAMMPTPTGLGYWLLAADGGIFSFGDAVFHGSTGDLRLNAPVVGGASTPTGQGYWLVAADGGLFSFGDASFYGSTGDIRLNAAIVAMSIGPNGVGYRFVAIDGGIFSFGAPFFGSGVGAFASNVVAMASRPQGDGYWLVTNDGSVLARGGAPFLGSLTANPLSAVKLATTVVVNGSVTPTALTTRPGDSALYYTEKTGAVRALRNGVVDATPVVTIDSAIIATMGERGLLGLAFSADGSKLYLDHTLANGDLTVVEYTMNGSVATASSRRTLLTIAHSTYPNHNGGDIHFGPDGYLWIATGDGGSGGDPGNNAQSTDSLLGKLLRIDPRPSGPSPYTIPPDNPFRGQAGKAPEIAMYGLRNPWRFSFDRATGDLWIADVGQALWEEIDFNAAPINLGTNYGWNKMEGTHSYNGGSNPAGAVLPVTDYGHSGGDCSITGGYVYRGTEIPGLVGAYVFADFCSGRIGAMRQRSGTLSDLAPRIVTLANPVSFAQDGNGELFVLTLGGSILRIGPG